MDQLVLGHRIRHFRKRAGLTLDNVSEAVGRPPSYLSQVENGHIEPRVSLVDGVAKVLGCSAADLMSDEPPTRRSALEIKVERIQVQPRYQELGLPYLKPTAKTPDDALEHIVALYESMTSGEADNPVSAADEARQGNAELRRDMRARSNYYADIELAAAEVLEATEYGGTGPISERTLMNIAANQGFTIERVRTIPRSARSVTDQRNRIIYVPQRDDLATRSARSVVLQTLGHFVLGHRDTDNFRDYVRQRIESNYFAAAVLAPEKPAVEFLRNAYEAQDISVEDLKEVFYISYEMAAHRLTNLATEHLGLTLHFLRSDEEGVVWKAYENDDVPLPMGPDGTIEGQRLCREWGTRQAFASEDAYSFHYQYTEIERGEFWCVTYVEADRSPRHAVTVGTDKRQAKYFRGSDTTRRSVSHCPDEVCCRHPAADQNQRWAGVAWPSAKDRSHILSGLPAETAPFTRFPGVDMVEVFDFLDRQAH